MSLSLRFYLSTFFLFSISCIAYTQSLPYQFVENKRQWDTDVLFRADVPNGYLFFHQNQLTYSFYDASSLHDRHAHGNHNHQSNKRISGRFQSSTQPKEVIKAHGVQVSFLGSNPTVKVDGKSKQDYFHNYFLGKNPSRWSSNAGVYAGVTYQNLYHQIDLQFIQNQGVLKYEFIVEKGGNPENIQLSYEGAEAVYLQDGNLHVETTLNTIIEQEPFSYQLIHGDTIEVPSQFKYKRGILTFDFPEGYNANYDLVIDPVLVFSRYSQSISDNWGNTATYDNDGNSYVGGIAFGSNFPTTVGAFDVSKNLGEDVVIMKYNTSGTSLLYSTFLGGDNSEIPISMIVNSRNQLIIMGITGSQDFPIRSGFDNSFNGGSRMIPFPFEQNGNILGSPDFSQGTDIFLAILNENGSNLVNSTFLGGSENDGVMGGRFFSNGNFEESPLMRNYGDAIRGEIILDSQDNIYLASASESSDFPTSATAYDKSLNGLRDAILVKMNSNLSQIVWSTFLGGSNVEGGFGLTLANNNSVYMVGGTASSNFPTSLGTINTTYQQGSTDGYIAHISNDGANLLNATFLGTNSYDQAYLVDLDSDGNPVVFGQTLGFYPINGGSIYNNPNSTQFIHKLNPNLSSTFFSTTLGSGRNNVADIVPTAFTVTNCNSIYLAGWGGGNAATSGFNLIGGSTFNMPTTPNAIQNFTDGADFYVAILSGDAQDLQFGSFMGASGNRGDHVDGGTSRFDPDGIIYQAVCSCTPDVFPQGSLSVQRDNCNMLVFKIDLTLLEADFTPSVTEGCVPLEVDFTNESEGGVTFNWDTGDGTTLNGGSNQTHTYTEPGEYIVQLTISDPTSCLKTDVHFDTITVFPREFSILPDTVICNGDSIQISASGAEIYQWLNDDIEDKTVANPVVKPTSTTDYEVIVTNEFGCIDTLNVNVRVNPIIEVDFEFEFINRCEEPGLVKLINKSIGTDSVIWEIGDFGTFTANDSIIFNFDEDGDYVVSLETLFTNNDTCVNQAIAFDTIQVRYPQFEISSDTIICFGDSIQVEASGARQYQWLNEDVKNDTISSPFVSPTVTTKYQVFVQDSIGCTDTLSVTIEVQPIIEADFSFQFPDRCKTPGTVAFFNQSNGSQDLLWRISDLATFSNQDTLTYEFIESGDYIVQLEALDTTICVTKPIHTDTIKVRFPEFEITTDTAICEGSSIQLLAEGAITYKWLNEDIIQDEIPNPIVFPLDTTLYEVVVVDSLGCSDTLRVEVGIIENLNSDFNHEFVDECASPGLVQFTNQSRGSNNFVWNIADFEMVENQDTLSFNFEDSGEYIVTLEGLDTTNCVIRRIAIDTIIVEYNEYIITTDTVICEGEPIELLTEGAVSYRWISGENISNINSENPAIRPTQTQEYQAVFTNKFGCQDTLSTTVTVLPTINVDFDIDLIDPCANPNIGELTNTSTGTTNFKWEIIGPNLDGEIINDSFINQDTVKYQFLIGGEYIISLIALDSNKCSLNNIKRDTLQIEFPVFTVSNDTTICEGSEIIFSARDGAEYQWFLNETLISNNNLIRVSPDTTTTYDLIIFDGEGCSQEFSLTVNVVPNNDVQFEFEYLEKCEAPHQIKFTNTSAEINEYNWLVNDIVVGSNQRELIYTFEEEGDFVVKLQSNDLNPCGFPNTFSETFNIDFVEITTTSDTSICFGDAIQLQVNGLESFIWQPAQGINELNINNPTVNPTQTTTYNVATFNNECRVERSITINVVPEIILDFDFNLIASCNELPLIDFKNQSEGAVEYIWQLGDGQIISSNDLQYRYSKEGEYNASLIGLNDICQEQITKSIIVKRFIPPNAFSPNGDTKNQYFDLGEEGIGLSITIFNRWGEEVYQSENYQNDWDGNELPEGVYFYQLLNTAGESCKGWVKLLR